MALKRGVHGGQRIDRSVPGAVTFCVLSGKVLGQGCLILNSGMSHNGHLAGRVKHQYLSQVTSLQAPRRLCLQAHLPQVQQERQRVSVWG